MPMKLNFSHDVSWSRRLFPPAVLALLIIGAAPPPSSAQIAKEGLSKALLSTAPFPIIGTDVAYDPGNKIYLVVGGYGEVYGGFVNTSGDLVAPVFRIGTASRSGAFGVFPKAQFSPDLNGGRGGFLVAWQRNDGTAVHSVVIAYPGGAATQENVVSDPSWGSTDGRFRTAIAYSASSRKFLVAWTVNYGIQGRFLDTSGTPVGPVMQLVEAGTCLNASLAWNPATNDFGLAYAGIAGGGWIGFRLVRASDGQLSSPTVFGWSKGTFNADVDVNPSTSHYVIGWSIAPGAFGAELDASGKLIEQRLLSYRLGTPTSFDLAYSRGTGTFLAVSEDLESREVAATELDGAGVPMQVAVGITDGASTKGGSYSPMVIGRSDAKQWNISYSRNLDTVTNQVVSAGAAPGPAPLKVTISSSVSGPVMEGTPITWTGNASGGTGPLQYKFVRYSGSTGWSVAQDYTTKNTYTWFPAAGSHAVQVWVRNAGSTAPYDVYAGTEMFTVTSAGARVTSFTADKTYPAAYGMPITWTATASAGGAAVEYQFWRWSSSTGWVLGRDYSSNNTFTWFPPLGSNAVQVWVRIPGSGVVYQDWRGTGLFDVVSTLAAGTARLTGLTVSGGFPVSFMAPSTWTATATGGSGPLEYKFFLYDVTSRNWTVFRDWAGSNQAVLPALGVSGSGPHAVQVWVRSAGSTAAYEDWRSTEIFNISLITSVALTADAPWTSASSGRPITFTAWITGGLGPIEYSWMSYNGTSWVLHQAYTTGGNTMTATFPAGTRAVQVWVRSAGSPALYEAWQTTGVFTVR